MAYGKQASVKMYNIAIYNSKIYSIAKKCQSNSSEEFIYLTFTFIPLTT